MRLLLTPLLTCALLGQAGPPVGFFEDATLRRLLKEAAEANPELKTAEARIRAAQERVPQAGAFNDPVLTLGYQNDGFDKIQYGMMETTWATVMLTQGFSAPGKRRMRSDLARTGVQQEEAGLARTRLGLEADVRRAYLDLIQVRSRSRLLEEMASLWKKAEGVSRIHYETGQGPQVDLLRASLERIRLEQERVRLRAEETRSLAALGRLRGRLAPEPLEAALSLEELPLPAPPTLEEGLRDAEARSPEWRQAGLQKAAAAQGLALARRDLWPDFSVSAGYMPRGSLDPMWQVGLNVSLPVFQGRKQRRAIAEREAVAQAEALSQDRMRQLLHERVTERLAQWQALAEVAASYRRDLLPQSRLSVESAMAPYESGRVPLSTVLEVLRAHLADRQAHLEVTTQVLQLAIAQEELSLSPGAGMKAMAPAIGPAMVTKADGEGGKAGANPMGM